MSLRDYLFADLILENGRVLTMDAGDSVAEAVAIKDGKVLGTGANEEVRELAGSRTRSYPSDPLRDAGTLVSRKTANGNSINPEEAVTVREALRAQTINAAYVGFEEQRLGSLEPGKLADVTVLGEDPFEFPPEQFNQLPVDMVIVGGQVHEHPRSIRR